MEFKTTAKGIKPFLNTLPTGGNLAFMRTTRRRGCHEHSNAKFDEKCDRCVIVYNATLWIRQNYKKEYCPDCGGLIPRNARECTCENWWSE